MQKYLLAVSEFEAEALDPKHFGVVLDIQNYSGLRQGTICYHHFTSYFALSLMVKTHTSKRFAISFEDHISNQQSFLPG